MDALLLDILETVADPQSLLEEKEALEEKLAVSEYEFRLAQEDIAKLKKELQRNTELSHNESGGRLQCLTCVVTMSFYLNNDVSGPISICSTIIN